MLHVTSARCVACDLHKIAPGPLLNTHVGDCLRCSEESVKVLELRLWMRLLLWLSPQLCAQHTSYTNKHTQLHLALLLQTTQPQQLHLPLQLQTTQSQQTYLQGKYTCSPSPRLCDTPLHWHRDWEHRGCNPTHSGCLCTLECSCTWNRGNEIKQFSQSKVIFAITNFHKVWDLYSPEVQTWIPLW